MSRFLCIKKIIFPDYILDDRKSQLLILKWILIGLLIRLAFMPFTAHNDFLSEHVRVAQILRLENMFPGIFQFFSHYIDAFFAILFKPLLPGMHQALATPETGITTVEIVDFLKFSSHDYILRMLFIFKIPYLIFDYSAMFILLKILNHKDSALRVVRFWMINPVIIYSVYIFGRFEIYPIFFIVLFFYVIKKLKNPALGFFILGISIICRGYPIIILPIILLCFLSPWVKKLYYLGLSIIPLFLTFIAGRAMRASELASFGSAETIGGKIVTEGSFMTVLLRPVLDLAEVKISVMVFVYAMLIIFLVMERKKILVGCVEDIGMGEDSTDNNFADVINISRYCFIFFIFFYIFCDYSPHWFSWFIPFFAILVYQDRKYERIFYILTGMWAIYWIFASDIGVFSTYLLVPLGGVYFHDIAANYLTRLYNISFASLRYDLVLSAFRAVFSAGLIYALINVFRDIKNESSLGKV